MRGGGNQQLDPQFNVYTATSGLKNRLGTFIIIDKREDSTENNEEAPPTIEMPEVLMKMLSLLSSLSRQQLEENKSMKVQLKVVVRIRCWVPSSANANSSEQQIQRELSEPFPVTLCSKQYVVFLLNSAPLEDTFQLLSLIHI